ncbi:hypothetical protein ACIQ8G_12355 [Streptomyces sp. NPDC094154]|uniref:hypothetical protein n=1 Tax=Streptomyces sp. NPDC094154 TaxID=3366059 RepID=UPI0037FC984F
MASFVDDGLPATREEWPPGVLGVLEEFTQGDVVACPQLVFHGSPSQPLTQTSQDYALEYEGDMPMQVHADDAPRWALVTSGTCDLAEADAPLPLKPFVQVSPIVDMAAMDGGKRKLVRQGKINYLIHVPLLSSYAPGFWVADLRFEYPVEKGWLASQERLKGFESERHQEVVGRAVAWLRERPAMSGDFVRLVARPVRTLLGELRVSDREAADRLDREIAEWAVAVDSRLEPKRVEIILLSEGADPSAATRTWWREAVDCLREEAGDVLLITGPRFERLDQLSVSDYRRLTPLAKPHQKFSNE